MVVNFLRKVKFRKKKFVDRELPKYFYKSPFLSSLYYTFFSPAFHREHQAVLTGKVVHTRDEENYYLLVRNTHRLEKGLLMKPRRAVFGKEYIEDTVKIFIRLWSHPEQTKSAQLRWSKDVLNEYFSVVQGEPKIDKMREAFHACIKNKNLEEDEDFTPSIPYFRKVEDNANITYEEFYKLTRQRRSVRWFLDKPVPRELIDKAILAANQSPSACNRQPFEYRIFDNRDLARLASTFPMGTSGYSDNIPVLVVVVGNLNAYFSERDRHLIYIDASLANMSFMLALETMDLSSCSINWPDIEGREKKMAKFLGLKEFQRPIMCLGVGYPDPNGQVAFSEKRSLDQLRTYNNEV